MTALQLNNWQTQSRCSFIGRHRKHSVVVSYLTVKEKLTDDRESFESSNRPSPPFVLSVKIISVLRGLSGCFIFLRRTRTEQLVIECQPKLVCCVLVAFALRRRLVLRVSRATVAFQIKRRRSSQRITFICSPEGHTGNTCSSEMSNPAEGERLSPSGRRLPEMLQKRLPLFF